MPFSRDISKVHILSTILALSFSYSLATSAQAPVPDNQVKGNYSTAPIPGSQFVPVQNNIPNNIPNNATSVKANAKNEYYKLPISLDNAMARLEELRNLMMTIPAKDFQERMTDYLEWLSDLADSHWRLSLAFAKSDITKAKAEAEKDAAFKFGHLKRQGQLLKAEFLVKQNRLPEALAPLVEIVQAEPNTATGESAYALLKQIGFSQELPVKSSDSLNQADTIIQPVSKLVTPAAPKPAPAIVSAPSIKTYMQKTKTSAATSKKVSLSSNKLTTKAKR